MDVGVFDRNPGHLPWPFPARASATFISRQAAVSGLHGTDEFQTWRHDLADPWRILGHAGTFIVGKFAAAMVAARKRCDRQTCRVANQISGGGAGKIIDGKGGNDSIYAGGGDDSLMGGMAMT